MTRLLFRPVAAPSGSLVRFDTVSGSDSPADITPVGGGASIANASIRAHSTSGSLPAILGPDGVTTLYQKTLDYRGVVTGSPTTLTGAGEHPTPFDPSGTYASPQGAWSSATAYGLNAVVTYNGSTYRAKAASTNVIPGTDATKWESWGAAVTQYGLPIGRGTCIAPIGLRGHAQLDVVINSATSTSATYRQFWPLSDPKAGSVLPVFGNVNWYQAVATTSGDTDAPNPITIACAVECSDGTVKPFTFNGGNHTVTIPAAGGVLVTPDSPLAFGTQVTTTLSVGGGTVSGVYLRTYVSIGASRTDTATVTSGSSSVADAAILASDLGRPVTGTGIPASTYVGAPLVAGTSFTLVQNSNSFTQAPVNATAAGTSVTISSQYPINNGGILTNADVSTGSNGADLTTLGSAAVSGGGNSASFGPVALLGPIPSGRKPIVVQISDSIFNGTTDSFVGPVQRACITLGYPLMKLSKFSEYARCWSASVQRRYREQLVPGCTHAIVELGTNDGVTSTGLATTLQGYLTSLVTWLNSLGIQVYLTTVPPKGISSTDGYATLAGQTPSNTAVALAQINTWIRSVPTGCAGYIELGNLVSSAQDSGLFAVGPNSRQVTDAAVTTGTNIVTSATANFTSADIGTGIYVAGAITTTAARVGAVTNSTTVTVVNVSGGAALNATATVSGAVAGIGSWYATADGTHPSTALMLGSIEAAVQTAMTPWTVS